MAYRYYGSLRMDLTPDIAYVKIDFLGIFIDYGGGLERERWDYDVYCFSCAGEWLYTIRAMQWSEGNVDEDKIYDARTLAQLITGCCPLELTNEILEGYE